MANFTNILLAGAAAFLLLGGKKKKIKASDGKVFSSQEELDAYEAALKLASSSLEEATKAKDELENVKTVANAAKDIKESEEYYAKRVIVSDITMQFFNDGKIFSGFLAGEFPYHYIIWAKFANMSSINVNVVLDTVLVTLVHSTNSKPFPINYNNIIIPAHTETKWLPIVVCREKVVKKDKYYDNDRLYKDIKEYFPRQFNFFLPAHFYIKYNVEVPNQDTILAKDVIFEINREALSVPTKEAAGWFDFSFTNGTLCNVFKAGDPYKWVARANWSNGSNEVIHKSDTNLLDPDNNPSYLSYLHVLRSNAKSLKLNKPIRYIWYNDYLNGYTGAKTRIKTNRLEYDYSTYPAKAVSKALDVLHPYMGIVYDDKGIVAYA